MAHRVWTGPPQRPLLPKIGHRDVRSRRRRRNSANRGNAVRVRDVLVNEPPVRHCQVVLPTSAPVPRDVACAVDEVRVEQ